MDILVESLANFPDVPRPPRRPRRLRMHERKMLKHIPVVIEPAMEWGERWDDARIIAEAGKNHGR